MAALHLLTGLRVPWRSDAVARQEPGAVDFIRNSLTHSPQARQSTALLLYVGLLKGSVAAEQSVGLNGPAMMDHDGRQRGRMAPFRRFGRDIQPERGRRNGDCSISEALPIPQPSQDELAGTGC